MQTLLADLRFAARLQARQPAFAVTAVVVLSESHVSIHTWPEWGGATIDAYTCGDPDPVQLIEHVIAGLGPAGYRAAVAFALEQLASPGV